MPSARFLLPGIFPLSCFPPFFLSSSLFYPSPPFLFPLLPFSALFLPFPARFPALPLPLPRRSLSPSGFSRSPPQSTKKERPESAPQPPVCPRRTTRPAKAENSNPIKIRIMSPPDKLRQLLKSAPNLKPFRIFYTERAGTLSKGTFSHTRIPAPAFLILFRLHARISDFCRSGRIARQPFHASFPTAQPARISRDRSRPDSPQRSPFGPFTDRRNRDTARIWRPRGLSPRV